MGSYLFRIQYKHCVLQIIVWLFIYSLPHQLVLEYLESIDHYRVKGQKCGVITLLETQSGNEVMHDACVGTWELEQSVDDALFNHTPQELLNIERISEIWCIQNTSNTVERTRSLCVVARLLPCSWGMGGWGGEEERTVFVLASVEEKAWIPASWWVLAWWRGGVCLQFSVLWNNSEQLWSEFFCVKDDRGKPFILSLRKKCSEEWMHWREKICFTLSCHVYMGIFIEYTTPTPGMAEKQLSIFIQLLR